jgi:hypothetical protein
VLHAAISVVETMLGESYAIELQKVPLAGDSMGRRISYISDLCIELTDQLETSSFAGLQALIRKKAPHIIWTHCMLHRQLHLEIWVRYYRLYLKLLSEFLTMSETVHWVKAYKFM